ncbi:MAG: sugar ABC transporter permease [Treponema sp.]|nr:sugar ABC transporter permease [Treponema sp.]
MKDKITKTFEIQKYITSGLSWASKISILLLFIFMFIGHLNPARFSSRMDSGTSIVKSAFYFRGYVAPLLEAEKAGVNAGESTDEAEADSESYDDFYSNFAAMVENSAAADSSDLVFDDFDENAKAKKIKANSFAAEWNAFKGRHLQIAQALEDGRKDSIFTFIAIFICIIGVYLACGSNKIRKIGNIVICAGSVLTIFSMTTYAAAQASFASALDSLDVAAINPNGAGTFITFSVIALLLALALIFVEKAELAEDGSKVKSALNVQPFQITYRLLALLLFVLLFIPGANPARISLNISRNVSLFTAGFSYGTYTQNMERLFIRGWLPESVMVAAFISSLVACLGIIACGAGSCMSVGNSKLKRYAHITILAGSAASFASMFGLLHAYNLLTSSENVAKIEPLEPHTVPLFCVLLAFIFVCALVAFIKSPAPEKGEKCHIEAPLQLFLMLLPFLLLVFIFSYLPLWGWRYAFFDYNAGDTLSMDKWVGLKWFKAPFENAATRSDILRVLRNTLVMSGLGIATSWLPMIFAIFLSEIKNTQARKVIQTLTTIPNFISWVLVYAIAFCIFGTEGFISSLMVNSGIWEKGVNMLMGEHLIWVKMWLWGTWKGLGWSAIMYIAAISGIDQQLYEAATVDGAGRFQKIWHITIPELFPTYIVLLILSVSNILSNGMDQYLVFKNPTNKNPIEVLDLYVYQLSFGQTSNSNIPFSTVVSMFKSLVSVILLFITNKISKWVRGSSIF